MEINTRLIHGYDVFDSTTGATAIPKFQASTFKQDDLETSQPFTYSRFANPTRKALEEAIAAIEGGKYGFAFSSGMATISAVLLQFNFGDHVIMCRSIYGGTFQLATQIMTRFGIEVTFVDETDLNAWEAAIKPNTKAIYLETPSNPLLKITDIKALVSLAKMHHVQTIIDNTFMTPQFQHPLALGVDVVIHSATKFINGHSDVVAGLVVVNDEQLANAIKTQQTVLGGVLGVEDSWLVMRGMKTMGIRMQQSAASAAKIASFLTRHPQVQTVHYPGSPHHEGFRIHQQQASSGGAVLSFELASQQEVFAFVKHLTLAVPAVSLGGVESIISYPATMSHACVPRDVRLKQGITDGLVRLSVGIEDCDDLLNDLAQGLQKLKRGVIV